MTLPMDIRLASSDARFGFVFAARGIVPEAASSWFLPRVVGIQTALEWCYTARIFPAAEALDAGLVRSVHPRRRAPRRREVRSRSRSRRTPAPVSVALTRMMMWRMLGASHPMEAHRIDSRGMNHTGRCADATEGITRLLREAAGRVVDAGVGGSPAVRAVVGRTRLRVTVPAGRRRRQPNHSGSAPGFHLIEQPERRHLRLGRSFAGQHGVDRGAQVAAGDGHVVGRARSVELTAVDRAATTSSNT